MDNISKEQEERFIFVHGSEVLKKEMDKSEGMGWDLEKFAEELRAKIKRTETEERFEEMMLERMKQHMEKISKEQERSSRERAVARRAATECYACGKTGHIAKNCATRRWHNAGQSQENKKSEFYVEKITETREEKRLAEEDSSEMRHRKTWKKKKEQAEIGEKRTKERRKEAVKRTRETKEAVAKRPVGRVEERALEKTVEESKRAEEAGTKQEEKEKVEEKEKEEDESGWIVVKSRERKEWKPKKWEQKRDDRHMAWTKKSKEQELRESEAEKARLRREFPEVTEDTDRKLEFYPGEKCPIKTVPGEKVVQKNRKVPQAMKAGTEKSLNRLEKKGAVKKSRSTWRSALNPVMKPDGTVRVTSNLAALNNIAEKDPYETTEITTVIDEIQGAKWFTVLDAKDAFYHVEIEEEDKHKTAFEFNREVYQWEGMPMGFKNAPIIMQRVMNRVLSEFIEKGVMVYMDDIVIYGKTQEELRETTQKVMETLRRNKFRLNMDKAQVQRSEVMLLGLRVNGKMKSPDIRKQTKALDTPRPVTIKQLMSFLGLTGYFMNYIPNYASITRGMQAIRKRNPKEVIEWTEELNREFENIKEAVQNMKGTLLPNYKKKFWLKTDASITGLGAVLLQEDEQGNLEPVCWASRVLTPAEKNYGITEKEALAVKWAFEKFEYHLRGRRFILITDHKALEVLNTKPFIKNERIARWMEVIGRFDFEVQYQPGHTMGVADALSRTYEGPEESRKAEHVRKREETRQKNRMVERDGKQMWKHDNGVEREIPEEEMREQIIVSAHVELNHRSVEPTYYRINGKYYWPNMRKDIAAVLGRCEVCQVNNRKKKGGSEFVVTTRRLQKVGIDMIDMREEGRYIMVAIDYFTRMAKAEILESKATDEVMSVLERWRENGTDPEEIITDHGKEFMSEKMQRWCVMNDIKHRVVGVESHRSNGRAERLIGTIREGLMKDVHGTLESRVKRIVARYNQTWHSGIQCTPWEAWNMEDEELVLKNDRESSYAQRFVKRKREVMEVGDEVRIAQSSNLKGLTKEAKGRFTGRGKIVEICKGDSYLVKTESGKLKKKRHYDLKRIGENIGNGVVKMIEVR